MVKDSDIAELRAKADRYRMLARWISDRETIARIMEFSLELEEPGRTRIAAGQRKL